MVEPIRADYGYSIWGKYFEIFEEITGLSSDETEYFCPDEIVAPHGTCDWTDELTHIRQKMVDCGFREAVREADKRYIESGRDHLSSIEFEKYWDECFANDPLAHSPAEAL